jgi:hypothetical protein
MAYLQEIELNWNTFKSVKATLSSSHLYYLQNDLQYVPFCISEGSSPIQAQSLYYVNVNRDPKGGVSGPYATLTSGTLATATIQGITYTATAYGSSSVTITYVADAPALGQESVTVAGNVITVHIHAGTIAQQVLAAVAGWNAYNGNATFNSQASAYLVSAVIVPGNDGLAQTAQGPTALTGGVAAVTVLSDFETTYKSGGTKVASFSIGVGTEL